MLLSLPLESDLPFSSLAARPVGAGEDVIPWDAALYAS